MEIEYNTPTMRSKYESKLKTKSRTNEKRNSNELFEVEKVLKKGIAIDNKVYYKIKWINEPESSSTWEPLESLGSIDDLIKKYENELLQSISQSEISPKKIKNMKIFNDRGYLNIEWKKNSNNSTISDSYVLYEELRETHPELILDYLEGCLFYGKKTIKAINGELIVDCNN